MSEKTSERIPATERRESILAAATVVFGERGYVGATTDQIARAAGISQPYVVRMFGSKEFLFLDVLGRALDKLIETFRGAIAQHRASGAPAEELDHALGLAYVNLVVDRGILLSLMQAFSMGNDPVVGAKAREGFLAIYRLLRTEADFSPERVRTFLADGMLLNTLLGLQLPGEYEHDDAARELLECTFRTKLDLVVEGR